MNRDLLGLVNDFRTANGLSVLCLSNKLISSAQRHSEDMYNNNFFSHDGSDGSTPWTRMDATGFTRGDAENVAMGYSTVKAVFNAWLASSGHRANILRSGDGYMGAYKAGGYWTQDFGTSWKEECNN